MDPRRVTLVLNSILVSGLAAWLSALSDRPRQRQSLSVTSLGPSRLAARHTLIDTWRDTISQDDGGIKLDGFNQGVRYSPRLLSNDEAAEGPFKWLQRAEMNSQTAVSRWPPFVSEEMKNKASAFRRPSGETFPYSGGSEG